MILRIMIIKILIIKTMIKSKFKKELNVYIVQENS